MELTGDVFEWTLGTTRKWSSIVLSVREIRDGFDIDYYDAATQCGQQRLQVPSHLRAVRRAINNGEYTPTTFSASLSGYDVEFEAGKFRLETDDKIPLINGSHRLTVILEDVEKLQEKLAKTEDESAKQDIEQEIEKLLSQKVLVELYLDGDPQLDFVRLQMGKAVDRSHLFSLEVNKGLVKKDEVGEAFVLARLLNEVEKSPFQGTIRLDSKTKPKNQKICELPVKTLCGAGSDIATSLVGLLRVTKLFGINEADERAVETVRLTYQSLRMDAEEVLEIGKYLTPPKAGGKKGSATMLIGVAVGAAYYAYHKGRNLPNQSDLKAVIKATKETLNELVSGSFSTAKKRELMRVFCRSLFSQFEVEKRMGVPVELLEILSVSAFGITKQRKTESSVTTSDEVDAFDFPVETDADAVLEEFFSEATH